MAPLRFLSLLLLAGACGAAGWFGSRAAHEGLHPTERNRAREAKATIAPTVRELRVPLRPGKKDPAAARRELAPSPGRRSI
jgi:hypothetical protein